MHDDDHQRGAIMTIPTREKLLSDLRDARIELDCDTDEARAVMALEMVYKIREGSEQLRNEIKELIIQIVNDRRAKITEAFILSEYDAMKHQVGVLEAAMDELGISKKKGQGNK